MRRHARMKASIAAVAVAALLLVSSPLPVGMRAPDASAASGPTAMQQVANALKPPAWNGPTGAFQAMRAKGKHVFFINLTEEIPALHEWGAVMAQQLKLVGVSTKVCDAKGAPEGIITCMQQGIAQHPDLIVAAALDTKFIAGYMSQAKNAGIKLITGQTGIPGIPTATGDLAEATFNYQTVGNLLGAWYAADSGCKTAPQIITSTSSRQPSLAEVAGILSEIKLLCPHITPLPVQNVLIPDWATKLPTLTRSLLLAHKDLTYLLPLYDGMTLYMVQQIQQMNLGRPVKIGSFNATPVVMQNELAKTSPLAADVGGPNQWYGYALADQALRVLTGTAPVADEQVPLRLFTRANIGTINVKADESTWYGSVNVNCKYHTLWHIAC